MAKAGFCSRTVDDRAGSDPTEGENNVPDTPSVQSFDTQPPTPSTPLSPIAGLHGNDDSPPPRPPNNNGGGEGLGPTQPDEDDDEYGDDYSTGHNSNNNSAAAGTGGNGDEWTDILGDDTAGVTTFVRGTNIDLRVAAETFTEFIRNFHPEENKNNDDDDSDEDSDMEDDNETDREPFYLNKLRGMLHVTSRASLNVDTMDLYFHNEACQRLYSQLVHHPEDIVPLMDIVIEK